MRPGAGPTSLDGMRTPSVSTPVRRVTARLVAPLVALLAAALVWAAAPGPAPAQAAGAGWTGNLIRNGSAEKTTGKVTDYYPPATLKAWRTTDAFTARRYDGNAPDPAAYGTYLAKNSPGPGSRGRQYFVGAYKTSSATTGRAVQVIGLKKHQSRIRKGARARLVGWLGGYPSNEDRMAVTVTWLSRKGRKVGTPLRLKPVTRADRDPSPDVEGDETTMLAKRVATGRVPGRAWKAKVQVVAKRGATGVTGAYADQLSLRIR